MNKNYTMYLDDLRTPIKAYDIVARSYDEAVKCVFKYGVPVFISFDHDLGIDENDMLLPSGYDFAKWLIDGDLAGTFTLPKDFTFKVHSQNPVGNRNIQSLLERYIQFKVENI